ncbi:MAG: ATP-binding protein [Candidatus Ratteibacteria bacterium]|jgi:hypothetical protein
MDILNKPINSFNFDDIVEFCKQGCREGLQLDYKREMPTKSLPKHFAAFSNTRGGVIIIGVDEDKEKGIPKSSDGVEDGGKIEEKIFQNAANVEPLPSFNVWTTNVKNGRVFVLIRIFEGGKTPYYVQNDATIWVRTGSISAPIDIASPDATELLFSKREKADTLRTNMVKRANEVYRSALQRTEKERLALIAEENKQVSKQEPPKRDYKIYPKILGTEVSLCMIHIQPFYPARAFITPQKLRPLLESIHTEKRRRPEDFPPLSMESIPEGLLNFYWNECTGLLDCSQFYATGLIYRIVDVLDAVAGGEKRIWIAKIAILLFTVLKTADDLYRALGYQGELSGSLLLKDVQGITLKPIIPNGYYSGSEPRNGLLSTYSWKLELNTTLLNDGKRLQDYYIEKLKEICWSFGYRHDSENEKLFLSFLKDLGQLL